MGAGAGRVAHVVQAVEEADQVVAARRTSSAAATSKRTRSASPASAARLRAASIEPCVGVEADDGGRRVRLGEQQRRRAVPAADVGDRARRR